MRNLSIYLKKQGWHLVLPMLLLASFMSSAQAASTASFSAQPSGSIAALNLTITANIADADIGKTGNYYLVYVYNDAWYAHNGEHWVEYDTGALPIYASGVLASSSLQLAQNINLSDIIGAQLYIGYGLTENDMRAKEKYALVYTVTQDVQAIGPALVLLGSSADYAVLAKTAVSTVPASKITGDVGVSPAATSFLTGFSLTAIGTTSASSPQVTGLLHGGDMTPPTNSQLTVAVLDMEAAYTDAAGRPTPDYLNLGSGNIGSKILGGGLYNWGSSVTIPTDLALSGTANDVWIFQISGDLSIGANKRITLSGGALAKNIFWQVAGEAIIGAGAHFEGNILSKTAITLQTGATLNGRALAQSMVALDSATVSKPAP